MNYGILRSAQILAGAGVNDDHLALFDEQRNLDLCAGLKHCGLGGVCRGVALEAGVGLGDFESNACGGLNAENIALVGKDLANGVLLDELEVVGEVALVYRDELIALGIHEIIKIAIVIGILHLLALNISGGEFFRGVECALNDRTRDNVSYLGSDECRAFAGLDVLELYDLIDIAVHLKRHAVSEIAC